VTLLRTNEVGAPGRCTRTCLAPTPTCTHGADRLPSCTTTALAEGANGAKAFAHLADGGRPPTHSTKAFKPIGGFAARQHTVWRVPTRRTRRGSRCPRAGPRFQTGAGETRLARVLGQIAGRSLAEGTNASHGCAATDKASSAVRVTIRVRYRIHQATWRAFSGHRQQNRPNAASPGAHGVEALAIVVDITGPGHRHVAHAHATR